MRIPKNIAIGDMVSLSTSGEQWKVTDVQAHGPIGQLQASLSQSHASLTKTRVPLHDLFKPAEAA